MRYSYDVYKDILKGEYLDVYEGVKAHILGADLSDNKKEMSLCEVLDLFVKYQDEGKTVDEVTGGDIKKFSSKYTMAYYKMNPKDFHKDYRILKQGLISLANIFVILIIMRIISPVKGIVLNGMSSFVICGYFGFLIAESVIKTINVNRYKKDKSLIKEKYFQYGITIGAISGLIFTAINSYIKTRIVIEFIVIVIVAIVVLSLIFLYDSLLYEIYFYKDTENVKNMMYHLISNDYKEYNKKKAKKKKEKISFDEYIRRFNRWKIFMTILLEFEVLMVIVFIIIVTFFERDILNLIWILYIFNLPLSFKYGNTKDMSMRNIDIGIISYCFNHKLEEQVVEQIKLEYI